MSLHRGDSILRAEEHAEASLLVSSAWQRERPMGSHTGLLEKEGAGVPSSEVGGAEPALVTGRRKQRQRPMCSAVQVHHPCIPSQTELAHVALPGKATETVNKVFTYYCFADFRLL